MTDRTDEKQETVGFCGYSRRFLDFMWQLPTGCPYRFQGNTFCKEEDCDYHQAKPPSRWYKEKRQAIMAFGLTLSGKDKVRT